MTKVKPVRKTKLCTNKKCSHKGKQLDYITGFTNDASTKDGKSCWCKKCQRTKSTTYKESEKLNPMTSAEMKEAIADVSLEIKNNQRIKRELLYGQV